MDLQAAKPHLEEGTAYRPTRPYNVPSSNSNMVLSIVKKGPTELDSNRTSRINIVVTIVGTDGDIPPFYS